MKSDTSMFTGTELIYDDGSFAIAKGTWNGDTSYVAVGIRWYVEGGLGYPQTYGKPQWFLLPDSIGRVILRLHDILGLIKNIM